MSKEESANGIEPQPLGAAAGAAELFLLVRVEQEDGRSVGAHDSGRLALRAPRRTLSLDRLDQLGALVSR